MYEYIKVTAQEQGYVNLEMSCKECRNELLSETNIRREVFKNVTETVIKLLLHGCLKYWYLLISF
jgi:hypothetical protein